MEGHCPHFLSMLYTLISKHTLTSGFLDTRFFSRINEDPFGLSFDAGESLLRMHTSFAAFLIGAPLYAFPYTGTEESKGS